MSDRRSALRPWLVLLGCCMMQGGSLGVVMNTMGLFFTAVSRDLGFSVGGISAYKTIAGLSSCILMPFVGRVLYRYDTRFTLSGCALVMAVCTALMATFHQLWQWYAAAFLLGVASAMLLQASEPIILANWFHERLGFAIGLSAAFSGLMGMVCNLGFERVIARWGWRTGYCVTAAVCLGMILPMTLFVIRLTPEMAGCRPYGVRRARVEQPESELTMPRRVRWLLFLLLCLAAGCPQFCVGFSAQIVTFAVSKGKSLAMGAFLVSCSMLSNAGGKVLLGMVNDRRGLKMTCAAGATFGVPAFLLLLGTTDWVLTAGCLLYGAGMALAVITPPLLTRKFFRSAAYPRAFSRVMMLSTLISSVSTGVLGWMYDDSGSYDSAAWLCLGLCAGFLLLCAALLAVYRRLAPAQRHDETN